jgi:hypothetical protein
MNLVILLCLASGTLLGILLRRQRPVLAVADRLTSWAIYLLVYSLGIAVGANPAVLENLGRLGWQAALLCAGGILGSVCLIRLIGPRLAPSASHEK